VLFAAACVAGVASHYAIDVAGDYTVRHDTYDHIAHHSRSFALVFAGAFVCASALVVLLAALSDARKFRGMLGSIAAARGLGSPGALVARLVPSSLAVLVVMESIDGRMATGVQPGFASTLGGSIALGLTVVCVVATGVAFALWQALCALRASQRRIVSALCRLMSRAAAPGGDPVRRVAIVDLRVAPRCSELSRRAGKRAPPIAA